MCVCKYPELLGYTDKQNIIRSNSKVNQLLEKINCSMLDYPYGSSAFIVFLGKLLNVNITQKEVIYKYFPGGGGGVGFEVLRVAQL